MDVATTQALEHVRAELKAFRGDVDRRVERVDALSVTLDARRS